MMILRIDESLVSKWRIRFIHCWVFFSTLSGETRGHYCIHVCKIYCKNTYSVFLCRISVIGKRSRNISKHGNVKCDRKVVSLIIELFFISRSIVAGGCIPISRSRSPSWNNSSKIPSITDWQYSRPLTGEINPDAVMIIVRMPVRWTWLFQSKVFVFIQTRTSTLRLI